MANMSNAYGKITFESTSLEYLIVFVHYFHKVKSKEYYEIFLDCIYGTNFEDDREWIEKNSETTVLNGNTVYSFSTFFEGFGRYCFQNNLDFFFNLKKYETEINDLFGFKYQDMIKSMTIMLDYVDEEPASELLAEVSALLIPEVKITDGKETYYTKIVSLKITNHEYTAENLRHFNCYDEACSLNYLLKHTNDYFKDNEKEATKALAEALVKNPKEGERIFTSLDELYHYFDLPL